jgi:hypothetical protein
LTTGAKAGIAVGAVLGGIFLLTLLAFLLLKHRRNSKSKPTKIAELDSREKKDISGVRELQGKERPAELLDPGRVYSRQNQPEELDSTERTVVHELG